MVLSKYLNKEEAVTLKEKLSGAGIESVLREHGPTRFLWGGIFCQIQVRRADFEKAQAISDSFNKELKESRDTRNSLLRSECPQCKSGDIGMLEKKSILKKLIYIGVTCRRCNQCGHEWYT